MITIVAKMRIKADKTADAEKALLDMVEYVRANEPGTLAYAFYKLRDANRYAVLESFRDEAAEHLHMNSKLLAETGPKISACLIGTWEREYFDPLE